jgi:ABC-type multidrug transport system fused ATPase/permease subunit
VSDQPERSLSFPELLKRLSALVKPHWKEAAWVMFLIIVTLGLELVLPAVVGRAINQVKDAVSGARPASDIMRTVAFLGIFYVAIAAARSLMSFVTGVRQERLVQKMLWDLRRQLYHAMQRMSFSFFDRSQSGQLISRATSDVNRVARFFNMALFSTVEASVILTGVIIYMFVMSPLLAVVALSTIPITIYIVVRSARQMRPLFRDARDSFGDINTVIQENIAGVKVVRAFAREEDEKGKLSTTVDTYVAKILKAMDLWALRTPPAMFIYSLNAPLILAIGGYLVVRGPSNGGIELGTLSAFMLYMDRMTWRVQMVGDIVNSIARAGASADRIYEVLDAKPDVAERPGAKELPAGTGEVVFDKVAFSYTGENHILSGVDLCVKPGQLVAVVGHTGCGKTTLMSLIPRFYDVREGCVRVDGCDVRDLTLDSLRRSIGIVFQETFLFSTTVRENIAYARPDANLEEIEKAARAAQAHEFIAEFPQGYDTMIGERGVTLSGGQRQRIAIARALLANPRILIMDDATASVDSATERLIQEAMIELARGRTTFVIAHRVSSVRRADLIVVLNGGKVAEMGTHSELLGRGGMYKDIYEVQMAENHMAREIA